MTEEYKLAYDAANRADEAFQKALVEQFGAQAAGDKRYCASEHGPEVKRTRFAFRMANERLRQATIKMRKANLAV